MSRPGILSELNFQPREPEPGEFAEPHVWHCRQCGWRFTMSGDFDGTHYDDANDRPCTERATPETSAP